MSELTFIPNAPRLLVQEQHHFSAAAQCHALVPVNIPLSLLDWRVGERIQSEVLAAKRSRYVQPIVATLSRQLVADFGQSLLEKNPRRMVQFTETLPDAEIGATRSPQSVCSPLQALQSHSSSFEDGSR